jgi:hypothetical protein
MLTPMVYPVVSPIAVFGFGERIHQNTGILVERALGRGHAARQVYLSSILSSRIRVPTSISHGCVNGPLFLVAGIWKLDIWKQSESTLL